MDETIVAIATPLGEGGLGVIRLSGPQAFLIADQLFQSNQKLQTAKTHTLHHGWIFHDRERLDEAVVACFRSPQSYTGEDVVEISCHGSPAILKIVLRLSQDKGARLANPGEFTQRAFLNGKIDLLQAEAVAELIHAKSDKARKAASDQLRGAFSEQIRKIRQPLVDLLAHLEANLDFVDDEIPDVAWTSAESTIATSERTINNLISKGVQGRWLREGIRVAIAGRPNVGKSSLFNALLSLDRAIVTDVPGTTRDVLEERMEWDGFPFVLLDTAGLRDTSDIVESLGAERARQAHNTADIVLLVLDGSASLTQEEKTLIKNLQNKSVVVALNKIDKGCVLEKESVPFPVVMVSAKNHQGLAELKSTLVQKIAPSPSENESLLLTNERHIRHLETAKRRLNQAKAAFKTRPQPETIALDLREAIHHLSFVTGENTSEDVLNSIFQHFCIGK